MNISKAGEWFAQPVEKREKRKYGVRLYRYPLALESGEWKKFNDGIKRRYPIQFFFREILSGFFCFRLYFLKRYFYELKCRFIYKYNIIRLDIPPTWHDTSTLIPIVLEKLLVDFVEKETPWEVHDWSYNNNGVEAERDIRDAYDFFKNRKPVIEKEIDSLLHKIYGPREGEDVLNILNRERTEEEECERERMRKMEEDLSSEETRVLQNIIKHRNFLWT